MRRKKFTLLELIVVIGILALLVSIVSPNISGINREAFIARGVTSVSNMQLVSDMYEMENRKYPVGETPTIGNPKEIHFDRIYPEYSKTEIDEDLRYWVDYAGRVWGSTTALPENVHSTDSDLMWQGDEDTMGFNVYESEEVEIVNGKIKLPKMNKIHSFLHSDLTTGQKRVYQQIKEPGKSYFVSGLDTYGLETAPVATTVEDSMDIRIPEGQNSFSFTLMWRGRTTADWLYYTSKEIKPTGTDITYEFSASDDMNTWTTYTEDLDTVPDSKYLRAKITLSTTNSNTPILKDFKLFFRLLDTGEIVEDEIFPKDLEDLPEIEKTTDPNKVVGTPDSEIITIDVGQTVPGGGSHTKTIDLGESKTIITGSSDNSEIYQTSPDGGVSWSDSSYYPSTLPPGDTVRITVNPKKDTYIEDIYVITAPPETPVIPTLPPEMPSIGDDTYFAGGDDWEEISSFHIDQDALEVVDWTTIDSTVNEPTGTRVRFSFQHSADGSNWSSEFDAIEDVPNDQVLRVNVFYEKDSSYTGSDPSLEQLIVNYNFLDASGNGTGDTGAVKSYDGRIDIVDEYYKNGVLVENQTELKLMFPLNRVFTSINSTAILTENNQLYTFGANSYDQLGRYSYNSIDSYYGLPMNENLNGEKIDKVSVGSNFTIVKTLENNVYTFGNNRHGQLGTFDYYDSNPPSTQYEHEYRDLTRITNLFDSTVVDIKAGSAFGVYQTDTNRIYLLGRNILDIPEWPSGESEIAKFEITDLLKEKIKGNIVRIEAGGSHLLIVNDKGELYSLGGNYYGELGNGTTIDSNAPIKLNSYFDGNIVDIEAKNSNSYVITDKGTVYGFGNNNFGQLGNTIGSYDDEAIKPTTTPTPIEFEFNGKPINIEAGSSNTFVVTNTGQIYSFGRNNYGQLGRSEGFGDSTSVNEKPVNISNKFNGTVIDISCSGIHTIVLTNTGRVYTFGRNESRQLGVTEGYDYPADGEYIPNDITNILNH